MKATAIAVAGVALVGAGLMSRGAQTVDRTTTEPMVERRADTVSTPVCPNPCRHCSLTAQQAAPPLVLDRSVDPETEDDTVETIAATPGRVISRGRIIQGTVVLPDGSRYTTAAPLPDDPAGFTWRLFKNAENGKSILGLHVYAPRRDADLVVGTVRFSNAAVRPNGTGFPGAAYYDSFTLLAPPGWEWVTLPFVGQTVQGRTWVVIAAPEKGDHFARPREQMEWSYALIPAGNTKARAKAEAALRYQDVTIPDPVTNYGPQRTLLPTVDRAKYEARAQDWANRLLSAQAKGSTLWIDHIADVHNIAMGGHWMDGDPLGYAYGGFGIDPTATFADAQVQPAILAHAIMHRANVSRNFIAVFNADTGRPMSLYEWTNPPGVELMRGEAGHENEVELIPFLEGGYYSYHYRRFNTGTCLYEYSHTATVDGQAVNVDGLWDYGAHDIAHSVRAVRHAIVLVEIVNDPAARDDIFMVGETNRYGYFSDRADERTPKKNPGQTYYPNTLTKSLEVVRDKPGKGSGIDRLWAWSAFTGACAIEYETDAARRAGWVKWGKNMIEYSLIAADKFGFAGRQSYTGNFPDGVSGIQTFHEMLVLTHRVTLGMRVYDDALPPAIAATNLKALRSALAVLAPRAYGEAVGPPHWIGTSDHGAELPALDEGHAYGEGDPAHVWAAGAMTRRADPSTDEALMLTLPHYHPSPTLKARYEMCRNWFPDKSWSVEMESVLQQMKL